MILKVMKMSYILLNGLLIMMAIVRTILPFYICFGNPIVRSLNKGRFIELTPFWMVALIPWDVIFAISGIKAIIRNEREQIFENAFKLSIFGLCVIWFINGIGDRFQIRAPQILKIHMKKYYSHDADKSVVDLIQSNIHCCGFSNIFTWNTEKGLPDSCCEQRYSCNVNNSYSKGCNFQLIDYLEKLNVWLILVNFPFVELIAGLWSCLLTDYLPSPQIIFESRNRPEHDPVAMISTSSPLQENTIMIRDDKQDDVDNLSVACSSDTMTIHWFEEWEQDEIDITS